MSAPPCWHVLGAGAMGTLFAGSLLRMGQPCKLLTHRAMSDQRVLLEGERRTELFAEPLAAQMRGQIRYLLLTTKAYATPEALRASEPFLHPDAVVATSANGLGLSAAGSHRALLRAVTTEAAQRVDQHTVRRTGAGDTLMGDGNSVAPPWFVESLGRLPRWRWVSSIEEAVHAKFAINCVINPLTALHNCRNGELLDGARREGELSALCEETQQLMETIGWWPDGEALLPRARRVCENTADNQSSMLEDRLAGRQTELAHLNGHLLRAAQAAKLAAPHTERLVRALG